MNKPGRAETLLSPPNDFAFWLHSDAVCPFIMLTQFLLTPYHLKLQQPPDDNNPSSGRVSSSAAGSAPNSAAPSAISRVRAQTYAVLDNNQSLNKPAVPTRPSIANGHNAEPLRKPHISGIDQTAATNIELQAVKTRAASPSSAGDITQFHANSIPLFSLILHYLDISSLILAVRHISKPYYAISKLDCSWLHSYYEIDSRLYGRHYGHKSQRAEQTLKSLLLRLPFLRRLRLILDPAQFDLDTIVAPERCIFPRISQITVHILHTGEKSGEIDEKNVDWNENRGRTRTASLIALRESINSSAFNSGDRANRRRTASTIAAPLESFPDTRKPAQSVSEPANFSGFRPVFNAKRDEVDTAIPGFIGPLLKFMINCPSLSHLTIISTDAIVLKTVEKFAPKLQLLCLQLIENEAKNTNINYFLIKHLSIWGEIAQDIEKVVEEVVDSDRAEPVELVDISLESRVGSPLSDSLFLLLTNFTSVTTITLPARLAASGHTKWLPNNLSGFPLDFWLSLWPSLTAIRCTTNPTHPLLVFQINNEVKKKKQFVLQEISLDNSFLTDEDLEKFASLVAFHKSNAFLANLTSLKLRNSSKLTENSLISLSKCAAQLIHLQSIDLTGCSKLNAASLLHLRAFPSLHSLLLNGTAAEGECVVTNLPINMSAEQRMKFWDWLQRKVENETEQYKVDAEQLMNKLSKPDNQCNLM
jgi:hypothetical protein